jgi:hypothetical protein
MSFVILFFQEGEPPKSEWLARNTNHFTLGTTPMNSSPRLELIKALVPKNNPTILITSPTSTPLLCSTLWIVSSARTVELYPSGEYAGTFQGETLEESDSVPPGATVGPPLFAIKIDQESLPRTCKDLFVKVHTFC